MEVFVAIPLKAHRHFYSWTNKPLFFSTLQAFCQPVRCVSINLTKNEELRTCSESAKLSGISASGEVSTFGHLEPGNLFPLSILQDLHGLVEPVVAATGQSPPGVAIGLPEDAEADQLRPGLERRRQDCCMGFEMPAQGITLFDQATLETLERRASSASAESTRP